MKLTTEDTESTERENDLQCELAAWELLREAREQNAKLRDIADRAIENCECEPKCRSHYGTYCDCGRFKRNEKLLSELNQLKEEAK